MESSTPYIEIYYCPDEEHKNNPWLITHGNLPIKYNGKRYRIYLEEIEDNNTKEK